MVLRLRENCYQPLANTMNFLNQVPNLYPKAISFAPGRPMEHLFDIEACLGEVEHFVEHLAKRDGKNRREVFNSLGQYGRTNGLIHEELARHLAVDENIEVDPKAIAVTVGCQEAMSILLMGLFEDNDTLLVSDPSYVGITGIAQILGVHMTAVPMRDGELEMVDVRAVVQRERDAGRRPRALYHIPDFNNPLGTVMSRANREALLALAEEEDFLIFEDNPYGMFAYDGEPMPTIKSIDKKCRVVYLGTFAKTLYPGLRLGYMVADQEVASAKEGRTALLAEELSKVKSYVTVNTSAIIQAVAGGILLKNEYSLKALVKPKLDYYKQCRDHMLLRLEKEMAAAGVPADEVSWQRPPGGFFMTVDLPFSFNEEDCLICARDFGVIVCPMSIFTLGDGHERQIRLSFSYVDKPMIEEGIRRLARYIDHRYR